MEVKVEGEATKVEAEGKKRMRQKGMVMRRKRRGDFSMMESGNLTTTDQNAFMVNEALSSASSLLLPLLNRMQKHLRRGELQKSIRNIKCEFNDGYF